MTYNVINEINMEIAEAWDNRDDQVVQTWQDVAELVNIKHGTALDGDAARKRYNRVSAALEAEVDDADNVGRIAKTFTDVGDESDESLIERTLKECGLSSDAWNVKAARIKRWGTPLKNGPDETIIVQNWSVGLTLEPVGLGVSPEELLTQISKIAPPAKTPPLKSTGTLFVPSIYDVHIGKKAIDGDEDMAHLYMKCLAQLTERAGDFDHALLVVGNDLGNIDNIANSTTAGTPQNNKYDYFQSARYRCALMVKAIDFLLDHSPVTVMVIPGNHDRQTSYWLGLYIAAYYKNNKHVEVQNTPDKSDFFRWGKNLFMFAHGDKIRPDKAIGYMARRYPGFSDTKHHELFLGHLHTYRKMLIDMQDVDGVMVRMMPGLSGVDRWHQDNYYTTSRRGAIGLLYDKDLGWLYEFPAFI
jgi:hypothetical protein